MKCFKTLVMAATLGYATANPWEVESGNLSPDFIQGLEDGIILRDDTSVAEKMECPELQPNMSGYDKISGYFQPIKVALKLFGQGEYVYLWDVLVVFIENSQYLKAVIRNYEGSDYCHGLHFGQVGATGLINIGRGLVYGIEKIVSDTYDQIIEAEKKAPKYKVVTDPEAIAKRKAYDKKLKRAEKRKSAMEQKGL